MSDRRGVYRGVYSEMIEDPDYQALSPHARHVLLTLRLCQQNTPACLFRVYPAVLEAQTGYPVRSLRLPLVELVAGRWVVCEGPWETLAGPFLVWIRNGLRYDPHLRLADPKHRKAVERAISAFGRSPLVATFCDYYQITRPFEGSPEEPRRAFGDQSSPSPIPRPIPIPSTSSANGGPSEALPSVPRWGTPEALVTMFNAETPDEIPAVETLSVARRTKARAALRQWPDEAWWHETFRQFHRSRFLRGVTPRRAGHETFTADFDWLLAKGKDGTENAVKVHDGRYADG